MKAIISFCIILVVFCFVGVAKAETITFTVQKNDNFWKLAKKYQVNHAFLIAENRSRLKDVHNPNLIYPGQKFVVSLKNKSTESAKKADDSKVEFLDNMEISSLVNAKIKNQAELPSKSNFKSAGWKYFIFISLLLLLLGIFLFRKKENNDKVVENKKEEQHKIINTQEENEIIINLENADIQDVQKSDNPEIEVMLANSNIPPNESLEKCSVVIDEDGRLHYFSTSSAEISGSFDDIAKFIVNMNDEVGRIFLANVNNFAASDIFSSVRSLKDGERRDLELCILKEIYAKKHQVLSSS